MKKKKMEELKILIENRQLTVEKLNQFFSEGFEINSIIDLNTKNSILHLLVSQYEPNEELIRFVLEKNANPNLKNKQYRTPLQHFYRIDETPTKVIKLLLEFKADANLKIKGKNYLHYFCESDSPNRELGELLSSHSDINMINSSCSSPLMILCCKRDLKETMINIFLKNKANPNLICNQYNPFAAICQNSRFELIKTFLEHQSDPNIEFKEGCTPFTNFLSSNKNIDRKTMQLFFENKADISNKFTPLYHILNNPKLSFELLEIFKSNVELEKHKDYLKTLFRRDFTDLKVFKFYVENGASLIHSIYQGFENTNFFPFDILKYLLEMKASPNDHPNRFLFYCYFLNFIHL